MSETSSTGQLLLVGVRGKDLTAPEAALYRRIQPGGYIIFTRNIGEPEQLRKLIDDLRDLSEIEPIITIDQEGGRVSRLREIGEEPPNAQQLREKGDPALIERHGRLTGEVLRLFGFNLDLCPVLDISTDDNADNSLRGRCFGTSVEETVANAGEFNRAMRQAGVASCGKHFPGYSGAEVDPHWEMPRIMRSRDALHGFDLQPYIQLRDELDSLMSCHAFYPVLETEPLPASLSPKILKDLLRKELDYKGLVMTDDLDMGAILDSYTNEQRLRIALEAGNDLLMICHQLDCLEEAARLLPTFEPGEIDRALENLHTFKQGLKPPTAFSPEDFARVNREIFQLRVETLGEEQARQRSPEDGKRSPVELY